MTAFLDRAGLDRLLDRYETLRIQDGTGASGARLTPRQRVDALQVCTALYAAGLPPLEDQRGFWLRYLRPVLAETRQHAAALAQALDELWPTEPPLPRMPLDFPPPPPLVGRLSALLGLGPLGRSPSRRLSVVTNGTSIQRRAAFTSTVVVSAVVLAGGLCVLRPGRTPPVPPLPPAPAADGPAARPADRDEGQATILYAETLTTTVQALAQYDDALSPATLASVLSGAYPVLGTPSTVLAGMMRQLPLPPYAPLPASPMSAAALRQYAALATASRVGESQFRFEPFMAADARLPPRLAERLARFGSDATAARPVTESSAEASTRFRAETWPAWVVALPGLLALIPGALWAFSGRRRLRAGTLVSAIEQAPQEMRRLRRGEAGERGRRSVLQTSPVLMPPLPPVGPAVRALARLREARPGSRLDADRSLRATLASAGDLVAFMRPASSALQFLFLIRRDHLHDHERARALRVVSALSASGVAVTAFDYDYDPRRPTETSRADALTPRGRARAFDLRGLRDLHAAAILVLVTDGEEILDPFTRRPRSGLAEDLRAWPRRMLLTPVPCAEWGEREMRLADALDAPIGRASMAGMADLGLSLVPDAAGGRAGRAQRLAATELEFLPRVARWREAATAALTPDAVPPRPAALAFDAPLRVSAPPAEAAEDLIGGLRAWLGPAFLWFAACGIYPQLRFDLTLWLGQRLTRYGHPKNPSLFSEAALDRLCLLPWLRHGYMPDWLRLRAFAALTPREQAAAKVAVAELVAGANRGEGRPLGLAVWQADWRGEPLPADAVMLEMTEGAAPRVDPTSFAAAAYRKADRRWLWRALARLVGILAWGVIAGLLWPTPSQAPHPHGAYWPLAAFVLSGAVLLTSVALPGTRRLWARLLPADEPEPAAR